MGAALQLQLGDWGCTKLFFTLLVNHKIEAKLKDLMTCSYLPQFWLLSGSSVSQINTQLLYTGDGAQWISEGNSAWDKELKQLMKVQSPFIESIVCHMHVWLKRLSDFSWVHTSSPYFLRLVWAYPANNNGHCHCIFPLHLGVWGAGIPFFLLEMIFMGVIYHIQILTLKGEFEGQGWGLAERG